MHAREPRPHGWKASLPRSERRVEELARKREGSKLSIEVSVVDILEKY